MHRIALIGRTDYPEFRELLDWLAANTAHTVFPSPASALLELDGVSFDGIVFGQTRRGEFSAEEVESIHRAAPLARLAIVYGSWCEGETRSGRPIPGVVRWHWRQAVPRLAVELERLSGVGGWSQPRTATDFDRQLWSGNGFIAKPRAGLLAIGAANRTNFETVADPCRGAGYECIRLRLSDDIPPNVTAVLWDGPLDGAHEKELRFLVERATPAPVLLVLGFPRIDHLQGAKQIGAADLIAKPFLASDLLWRLERAIAKIPVVVVIPDRTAPARIMSPHFVNPDDAKHFQLEVIELPREEA